MRCRSLLNWSGSHLLHFLGPTVQQAPHVGVEMAGLASLGPVFGVAGVPADVFKNPYQGDLFGTGGTYMEGCVARYMHVLDSCCLFILIGTWTERVDGKCSTSVSPCAFHTVSRGFPPGKYGGLAIDERPRKSRRITPLVVISPLRSSMVATGRVTFAKT